MPFLGILNDDTVIPEEVDDGVSVRCPECDGEMVPRGPFDDGRARHFYHSSAATGDCSGGESDPHKKMKSIAISTLRNQFPDHVRCEPEVTLDTATTDTLPDTRRADALVEFANSNLYYGKGVIIEIQYRNHGKDLFAATHDYLTLGYSVYWASKPDFDNERLDFRMVESKFNQQEDDAYAVYDYDPDDFSTELAASLDWENPAPNCGHDWQDMDDESPEYESCPQCGTNRLYDNDRARYLYDDAAMLGPVARPNSSSSATQSSCARDEGHIWEPYGEGVSRCGVCNARKVEVDDGGIGEPRTVELDMTYMGNDLTELNGNPDTCTHEWESQRDGDYQCEKCGLIEHMPY